LSPYSYFHWVGVQVRDADDALLATLKELSQGFAGSELRDCSSAA